MAINMSGSSQSQAYHFQFQVHQALSQMHVERLEQVAEIKELRQRLQGLQTRYYALPAEKKYAQDPKLLEDRTRCGEELAKKSPASRFQSDLDWLQQTHQGVLRALESFDLPTARLLMNNAKDRKATVVQALDAVEVSLGRLEDAEGDSDVWRRHDELLVRIRDVDHDYDVLRGQWTNIDEMIRAYAIVTPDSIMFSSSAFDLAPVGKTVYQQSRDELEDLTTKATNALADRKLEDVEALLRNPEVLCERHEQYIVDLSRAVQEYQAAERRGTVDGTDKVNIQLANGSASFGRHSRFQLGFQHFMTHHGDGQPGELHGLGQPGQVGGFTIQPHHQIKAKPAPRVRALNPAGPGQGHSQPATSTTSNVLKEPSRKRRGLPDRLRYASQAISPHTKAEINRMSTYQPVMASMLERAKAEETEETRVDSGFVVNSPVQEIQQPTPKDLRRTSAVNLQKYAEGMERV